MSLRILHVSSNRWNSAIAEYALSSVRALGFHGHRALLVTLEDVPLAARAAALDMNVRTLPSFGLVSLFKMRDILSDFEPDVILTHGGPETVLVGLASGGRTPVVRVRGSAVGSDGLLASMVHDVGQPGVKSFVAPSSFIAAQLADVTKLPVTLIPLGIDTKAFCFSSSEMRAERPTMTIFGRFDPVKGHREFMKIFKRMLDLWQKDQPRPHLQIVGAPANLSARHLEAAAIESGLAWGQDVDVISGRVEDVPRLLRGTSVGVISSLGSEVICRVAEEFLCCGTPVIVSGVGSLSDVLFAPQMGVSYENLELAEAARLLVSKLEEYHAEDDLLRAGRAREAVSAFSLETMGQNLNVVVTSVARQRSSIRM